MSIHLFSLSVSLYASVDSHILSQFVSPSVTSWRTSQVASPMGTETVAIFRKNSSGRQWDLPIHPPSPVSVAALPQCITLKPKSSLRGSVYMTELSELHYGWSPSHLAFTCHVTIPSLLGLLPDAALGVWGCSAGFAENMICRYFPSFRCYCFLLFGMDSRTRSEKIQWKPVLLIFKNISLLLFFPFPLL